MKNNIILVLFLLLSSGIVCSAGAQVSGLISAAPEESPDIAEGVQAALKGENITAETLFGEAMNKTPGSRPGGIAAAMAFANSRFGQQHFGKMRFWLEKTAEDFPGDPEAFLLLADIALMESRYLECSLLTDIAQKCLEKFNENPERKKTLQIHAEKISADLAESREKWDEAAEHWMRLNESAPDKEEYLYRLGLAQYRSGNKESALKSLSEAEKRGKEVLPALIVLAQLAAYDGKKEEAETLLVEAMQTEGENPKALVAAADLELVWNRLDLVKQYAEKAKEIDPQSIGAELTLGIVDLYSGNYDDAEKKFDRIYESFPNHSKAMLGLSLALCEQQDAKKLNRAFTIARRNVDQNPQSTDALSTLAWVLIQGQAVDEAEKILTRQFDAGDMNSPGAYYLAVLYFMQNRKEEAILFLQSALENDKNFPKRVAAKKLLERLIETDKEKSGKTSSTDFPPE